MTQRLVIESESIYYEPQRQYVKAFTFLVDGVGNKHYPFPYPAKYMIPGESEAVGFSDSDVHKIDANVNFIRFLTVWVHDKNMNLLMVKEIPRDEIWACTLKFAQDNNWIDK